MKTQIDYEIYTDGACSGNPGAGGWAYLIKNNKLGVDEQNSGAVEHTTNNKMEMLAAVKALEAIKQQSTIHLFTDSKYLQQGMTEWIFSWQKKNWRTASGSAVKNQDLWQQLIEVSAKHEVSWYWVKAHADHPDNELVDNLARMAAESLDVK